MAVAAARLETSFLALAGEADDWSGALEDELARLDGRPAFLVLDLSAADAVDATALGRLVLAQKRLQRSGGRLALVSDRAEPLELLRRTGLDRVLDVTVR
jgi:anti-anti-sigma factor